MDPETPTLDSRAPSRAASLAFDAYAVPSYEVPAPFLDPDADLLVKSSDGVLFNLYKAILSTGSTVLRDMFRVPRPEGFDPIIIVPLDWPEPATTITAVLYQLYPIVKPEPTTIEELYTIAIAADKWSMDGVLARVRRELLRAEHLDNRPLLVYKIACRIDDTEMKGLASARLVQLYDPLGPDIRHDLDDLTARELVTLHDLRQERVQQCLEALEACLPTFCGCGWEVHYDSWHAQLKERISARPDVSSVPTPAELLSGLGLRFNCRQGATHEKWVENGLTSLRETLMGVPRSS